MEKERKKEARWMPGIKRKEYRRGRKVGEKRVRGSKRDENK